MNFIRKFELAQMHGIFWVFFQKEAPIYGTEITGD